MRKKQRLCKIALVVSLCAVGLGGCGANTGSKSMEAVGNVQTAEEQGKLQEEMGELPEVTEADGQQNLTDVIQQNPEDADAVGSIEPQETESEAPVLDLGRLGRVTTDEGSYVDTWMEDRKVALTNEGSKGVGCYYAFVDSNGNVILEGTEEAIWATKDGYARVIFCEPGTTEPIDGYTLYDYFDAMEYGDGTDAVYDAYVEAYDKDGNFMERTLLTGDKYWDRLSQGQKICPPLGGGVYGQGEYVDCYSLCTGDYSKYDTVDYEAVEGGFTVFDAEGTVIGTIPCDTTNHILLAKDGFIFVVEENGSYAQPSDIYYIND